MKKTLILSLFLCFYFLSVKAQLTVREAVPDLKISDWIANVPKDKSLGDKVVVIDFWATWCGPCIQAVPHFNELQTSFQDRDDIIFLSMSDEKPTRIQKTLKRIDFQTVVVTDETGQTQEAFGVDGIPVTFMIHKDKSLAWTGHPKDLTAKMIAQVLNGEEISIDESTDKVSSADKISGNVGLRELFKMLRDTTIQSYFDLVPTVNKGGLTAQNLPIIYYEAGANVNKVVATMLELPNPRVLVPDGMEEARYNIMYLNKRLEPEDKEAGIQALLDQILTKLNFKLVEEKRTLNVWNLEVEDASKLEESDAENGSVSDADDKTIFTAQPMEKVLIKLENILEVPLVDHTGLEKNYDFIINNKDIKATQESLKSYGLKLVEAETEIVFYRVENR